jgi:hypothetical protein
LDADARRRTLDAIAAGQLPAGGPSELAALDLVDDVGAGYWERWSQNVAELIRARARSARCVCVGPELPELDAESRCARCWGRR